MKEFVESEHSGNFPVELVTKISAWILEDPFYTFEG